MVVDGGGGSGGAGSGYAVDTGAMFRAASVLDSLRSDLQTIRSKAHGADPGWSTLGLLGECLSWVYSGTLDQVHHHLDVMDSSFGSHATNLQNAATTYDAVEKVHLSDLKGMLEKLDDTSKGMPDWGLSTSGTKVSLSAGGHELLGFDAKTDIPFFSTVFNEAYALREQDSDAASALEDSALVAIDQALPVLGLAADPFNFLISNGLGFLINLIKPLKELLNLVTGDTDAMQADIDTWTHIAEALDALAKSVATAATENLVGWQGGAAEAAATSLGQFVKGMHDTATQVRNLAALLGVLKAIMAGAQAAIISLLASLLEWLFFTWMAALAAEVPTAGTSTAAAAVASETEGAVATSRAVQIVDRVVLWLQKVARLLEKLGVNMAKIEESFKVGNGVASSVAPGFKSLRSVLTSEQLVLNQNNIATWGQIAGDTLFNGVKATNDADPFNASDDTIDRELNGTR